MTETEENIVKVIFDEVRSCAEKLGLHVHIKNDIIIIGWAKNDGSQLSLSLVVRENFIVATRCGTKIDLCDPQYLDDIFKLINACHNQDYCRGDSNCHERKRNY